METWVQRNNLNNSKTSRDSGGAPNVGRPFWTSQNDAKCPSQLLARWNFLFFVPLRNYRFFFDVF